MWWYLLRPLIRTNCKPLCVYSKQEPPIKNLRLFSILADMPASELQYQGRRGFPKLMVLMNEIQKCLIFDLTQNSPFKGDSFFLYAESLLCCWLRVTKRPGNKISLDRCLKW